ncbi:hypothetical protein [Brevibacillus brevis]|uniref:SLH domain-containing protein n=1 Tax=Brevibacillus brevis TaxID=1393 RepID=A0ABY9TFX7_BREBE|nr:hypothetical protein [Brevibacillus brevis]WNC17893.1 hypothetical protein RGB73_30455 [Brevibacillus brevis]
MPRFGRVTNISVVILGVVAVAICIYSYLLLKGDGDRSGTFTVEEVPNYKLVHWADNREFLGDSFDLRLPMWETDFLEFLVILNANDPDFQKPQQGQVAEVQKIAIEQGIIGVDYPVPTDKPISAEKAYTLVEKALKTHEISIEIEQIAPWAKRKYVPNDVKELTWDEALNLLYNMVQYRMSFGEQQL